MKLSDYIKPKRQKNIFVLTSWYIINYALFSSSIPWPIKFKSFLLRNFGAHIGKGVVIKPRIRIKYPWNLSLGDHVWVGEDVWIDNVDHVSIGSNVCISQGVFFLTGNHNYKTVDFRFYSSPIIVESEVWLTAKCILLPGAKVISGSIVPPASIIKNEYKNDRVRRKGNV